MSIFVHPASNTFHLQNSSISYIMTVLPNGQMGQLYFGKAIHDREDFSYLLEGSIRPHSAYMENGEDAFSLEHVRQEYALYGSSDFREPAIEVQQENGSRLSAFTYKSYEILPGKPELPGLPATYTETEAEAQTLILHLEDREAALELDLSYTIFADGGILTRSAKVINKGSESVFLNRVMSLCLDLPDADYDLVQFSGSWARERHPVQHHLVQGIHAVESLRGHSSHQQNPFLLLKRPETTEASGEALGFSLVYSGNFLALAQTDTYDTVRILMGIHPHWFSWKLENGEFFQAPEAVAVYSDQGMNGLSQTFHRLFRTRLCRGQWRDKTRPILLNSWEATYFDLKEDTLLALAAKAKACGVELFVLDDGWFGGRRNDYAGLGDWIPALDVLPEGIAGLSRKVEALGLQFGLWIEPEMVNPDSDLFRAHPDWILSVPGRYETLSRHQHVLDFSRPEVVDHIHAMIAKILQESRISYIKWDMNRSITECYSKTLPADRQGEVFHRYILGLYDLYNRLTREFPEILFESCAGGGGRFDPGMLYYAPQTWTSDNSDAIERLKIQYGTSYAYPLSTMASHVSAVPNHQVKRITPLKTRADVAFFGTFGYELDLGALTEQEQEEVRQYNIFMKENRALLQFGTFYRLLSPFEGNEAGWMVVSEDKRKALVGYYRVLSKPNAPFTRIRLQGLEADTCYEVEGLGCFFGDELMQAGLITSNASSGKIGEDICPARDFDSVLYRISACR